LHCGHTSLMIMASVDLYWIGKRLWVNSNTEIGWRALHGYHYLYGWVIQAILPEESLSPQLLHALSVCWHLFVFPQTRPFPQGSSFFSLFSLESPRSKRGTHHHLYAGEQLYTTNFVSVALSCQQ
jgi:hypothetical protein